MTPGSASDPPTGPRPAELTAEPPGEPAQEPMGAEPELEREHELERERKARRQAELAAEQASRELYERQRQLTLLEAVATASNEAASLDHALRRALELVSAHADFAVGHAYLRDPNTGRLHSTGVWHVPAAFESFRRETQDRTFERGETLPGMVLVSGRPEWIEDISHEAGFTRRGAAARAGLRSALAFPILIRAHAVGVLEFLTTRFASADPVLLTIMAQVGTQLGRVVERSQARAELQQLARQLASSNEELRRSNQELEMFASVASHDLSEPLRTVHGFIELLDSRYADRLDDQARNFIDYSLSDIGRMRAMIADVLEYARVGSATAVRQPVDAGDAVARALGALAPRISETGAEILLGELPVVRANPNELVRLLQNLIANGLKFARPGVSPRIRVGASALGPRQWAFSVTDNGVGVPARDRERIFNMFHRAERSGARPGAGIGLSTCAKIVAAHGGRIWVEDTPSGGSAFYFTLTEPEGEPAPEQER